MRKNLVVLTATAFLSGIYQSMVRVIWQPYALSLGASIPMLGVLNSLGGYGGLVTSLVQPIGGWMADQTGRKPFLAWASVAAIASLGLYFMAGQVGRWTLLIPAVTFLGISALSRPARGALVADSSDEAKRGTAYSLVFLATVFPGIFAPVLGGYISETVGRPVVFLVGLAFEVVSLALVIRWLSEPRLLKSERIRWEQVTAILKRSAAPLPHLRTFFLCMAADSFVWGVGFGVLFGMLSKDFGYTDAQLGVLNSTSSATMVMAQIPLGWFIDRYGAKPSLVLSEALGVLLMFLWLTQASFGWFVASFAVFGVVAATWVPAVMTHLTDQVPAGSRSEAIGQLSAFRGLVAFPAPALGGLLYSLGGFRAPIMFNLVGAAILTFAIAFFVKGRRQHQV